MVSQAKPPATGGKRIEQERRIEQQGGVRQVQTEKKTREALLPKADGTEKKRQLLKTDATKPLELQKAGTTKFVPRSAMSAAELGEQLARQVRALPKEFDPRGSAVERPATLMADGKYTKQTAIEEVKRLTGVDISGMTIRPGAKILFVVPHQGYWAAELTLADQVMRAAGYEVEYVTPNGKPPIPLQASLMTEFRDQAMNHFEVSEGEKRLAEKYVDGNTPMGKQLAKPINLEEWIPLRPTPKNSPEEIAEYGRKVGQALAKADAYDAMIIVGGSGAIMDLANHSSLHPLVNYMAQKGKPVAGICYGVYALAQTVDPTTRKSILAGRAVTGHSNVQDYTTGTAYVAERQDMVWGKNTTDYETYVKSNWNNWQPTGTATVNLELYLKGVTGNKGGFVSPFASPLSSVRDGPVFSGRTTPDAYPTALMMLAAMHGKGKLPERFVIDRDATGRQVQPRDFTSE